MPGPFFHVARVKSLRPKQRSHDLEEPGTTERAPQNDQRCQATRLGTAEGAGVFREQDAGNGWKMSEDGALVVRDDEDLRSATRRGLESRGNRRDGHDLEVGARSQRVGQVRSLVGIGSDHQRDRRVWK